MFYSFLWTGCTTNKIFYKNPKTREFLSNKVLLVNSSEKTESEHILHSIFRLLGYKIIFEESDFAVSKAKTRLHSNVSLHKAKCSYLFGSKKKENRNFFKCKALPKLTYNISLVDIKSGEEVFSEYMHNACPLRVLRHFKKQLK